MTDNSDLYTIKNWEVYPTNEKPSVTSIKPKKRVKAEDFPKVTLKTGYLRPVNIDLF